MVRTRLRLAFGLAVVFLSLVGVQVASAASPDIVISQVYGGGGNTGATLKSDFIELFNRGTTAVTVTGWSVQYASSTGTMWQKTDLSGTIQPGRYYLVREGAGTGGTQDLPAPDASGTIFMSATSGKVAVVASATPLAGGCPIGVIDLVGYGSANCFEGAGPAPPLTNTTAAPRAANGCTDSDNNSADFSTTAPSPRNSASPSNFCGGGGETGPSVSSTTPTGRATGVARTANVSITFSEPVNVSGSWYSISCGASGSHTAVQSGGPTTYTLDPDSDFGYGETCTVTVFGPQVSDQDALDPPDTMASTYVWSFTTELAPVEIHQIQGASHLSPLAGQTVSGVEGIVLAKRSNGFYMQDPTPDADPATSEGLFIFTSSAPNAVNVGDAVRVSGTVTEFRPGGPTSTNLTTTELTSPTTSVTSTGNVLPAATVIGAGGRMPPTTVIEDDASGSVETSGSFDPASDGIDFYESLEAMRVQLNNAVAVGPTNDFGEIPVLADGGAGASVRTSRGGIVIRPDDFNPERIFLDDVITASPAVDVSDSFPGALHGVVDYSFGNFKVLVTSALARVSGGLAREVTASPADQEIAVATFNVENLDPGDGAAKFDELANLIVSHLRSPDLIALEEVQDNDGPDDRDGSGPMPRTPTTVTDASATYTMLISAIEAAGGPGYEYRQIDPVDDADGGEPGGNIRVGFLFRPDRELEFVDRPGGTSTNATAVVARPSGPQLLYSPGRIEPANAAWRSSRKPLAGEFRAKGKKLFVIANHFNSKGGDQPLFGRFQPPARSSEAQRGEQAELVRAFVEQLHRADPNVNVVVLGDLNDFEFSNAVTILEAGGMLNTLIETLPQAERYSYVFEGNSQALDHILLSDNLFSHLGFAYDIVHVNSEFAAQASDHDPQLTRLQLTGRPGPK